MQLIPTNHFRLKILIVDDAKLVVYRLVSLLADMKGEADLHEAYSYEEAMAEIVNNTPDVLLLDIQMPGKNGIQLLATIRQRYPNMIIIMLTNMVSSRYKELCREMGANHFVDKSSDFEKIPGIILSLMPYKLY